MTQQTVAKWDIFEACFTGPSTGNPFTDVKLEAVFSQNSRTVRVANKSHTSGPTAAAAVMVRSIMGSGSRYAGAKRSDGPQWNWPSGLPRRTISPQ